MDLQKAKGRGNLEIHKMPPGEDAPPVSPSNEITLHIQRMAADRFSVNVSLSVKHLESHGPMANIY